MYIFFCPFKPKSAQSGSLGKYKEKIASTFRANFPSSQLMEGNLYGITYYLHKQSSQMDADNISKPIWDSLESHAYENDGNIKLRTAGIIDLNSDDFIDFEITNVSDTVLENFIDALDNNDHIIYIEIGSLKPDLFKFNLES